jgi:hypothetical protein
MEQLQRRVMSSGLAATGEMLLEILEQVFL